MKDKEEGKESDRTREREMRVACKGEENKEKGEREREKGNNRGRKEKKRI